MHDYEKMGLFYLGCTFDIEKKKLNEDFLLYDSKDLLTHAVCLGMTGSGKTGLCIGLIEEAAIDGIPCLIVDPKGDLSNLVLTFPEMKAESFLPWINAEDAQKQGLSPGDYAKKQAALWENGLAQWGQDRNRIQRLKDAADFTIYTPGSSAGIPVSILKSFEAPSAKIIEDSDLLRDSINTTVTSLLNLLGIDADPIQSREHILLSTILDHTWRQGENLDLANLIKWIQSPPVNRIGVFDLDSFYPSKDRFSLAMSLNNLLAAPGFSAWLEGVPLDINSLLYTVEGKPRVSILSIAHLSDTERMFFVSLLLTQLLGWVRTQSGTTSLRSVFYMDEIFGFFPPTQNPPSKAPLLTLLKQARAYGLGIVLATQNPVDLDYKGLSNAGTWFIGRLQTQRDKDRLLAGLEGANSSSGGRFDRQRMEQILAGLGKRVFLMNNVHEDEPVIFQTRWVMSYLRGPLTRNQIKDLMETKKQMKSMLTRDITAAPEKVQPAATAMKKPESPKPVLPPGIPESYIPIRKGPPDGATIFYDAELLCMGSVYYADARAGIALQQSVSYVFPFPERASNINWKDVQELPFHESDIENFSDEADAYYAELPNTALKNKNYLNWNRSFKEWLYRNHKISLLKSPSLNIVSEPGEPERDFRIRIQQAAREYRDQNVEKLRKKYAAKIMQAEEKIRRAELAVEREQEQSKQQKVQTAISFGATLFSALLGRKKISRTSLGRATTAVRGAGKILKEKQDIARAEDNLQALRQNLSELEEELSREIEQIHTEHDPLTEELESVVITPKKKDISVSVVSLSWVPYWRDKKGKISPAW